MPRQSVHYQLENISAHTGIDRKYYLNYAFMPHFHDKSELIYVTDGELEITLDRRTETISKNRFCLVLPWQVHSFATPKHSRSIILVFPNYLIDSFVKDMRSQRSSSHVFEAEPPVQELFMRHLYSGKLPDEYIISGILLALCHCFITSGTLSPIPGNRRSTLSPDIMQYISIHCRESLTLRQVSDKLGYSYCHLSHIFNDHLGMSFPQFLNSTRVNLSLARLRNSNESITSIAYNFGFSSVRSYNRNFKEIMGLTPTQYRSRIKEGLKEEDMLRLSATDFFQRSIRQMEYFDPDAPE